MKVDLLFEQKPYNQWGCGHRIQYRIRYHDRNTRHRAEPEIHLDRFGFHRLTKIREYWNRMGLPNNPIIKRIYFIKEED